MTRRRVLGWVLIVLLIGSFGVFFVRGIADDLRTQRGQLHIAVSSAPASDSYPVGVGAPGAEPLNERWLSGIQ